MTLFSDKTVPSPASGTTEFENPRTLPVQDYSISVLAGLEAEAIHAFREAREEERSRAKERIFSFRDRHGQWDPRNQRPELWDLFNGRLAPGESMRIFPLSNWTELDIWRYIAAEEIEVVPLYFASQREVVAR